MASASSDWPLPSTPAMPRISPARTSRLRPRTFSCPVSSRTRKSSICRIGAARLCDSDFSSAQVHFAADHQPRQLLPGRRANRARGHDLPVAHHRDAIGNLHDFAEFVRHDARPSGRPRGACAGRQITGPSPAGSTRRWVRRESEAARRDTKASESPRVAARQWAAIPLRPLDRAPARGDCSIPSAFPKRACKSSSGPAFPQAEHRVFHHGKSPHQHEFLMHHADAERDGVLGAVRGALASPSIRISPESMAWKP